MMRQSQCHVRFSLLFCLILGAVSARGQARPTTIHGYVIDSACTFIKNLKKPVSRTCAIACAKAGSPLVILSNDGKIYLPISSALPATSENSRLMKFAGDPVVVTGKVYDRNGALGLVIERINSAGKEK